MTQQPPAGRAAQEQFGRQASLYAQSPVHRTGENLDALVEFLSIGGKYGLAVDIGAGAGFAAFATSPYARRVLATDITPQMLAQTRRLAAERGLTNVAPLFAEAEGLPFKDSSVDLLTSRQAAHHFHDLPRAVAEAYRVLKPGCAFVFSDPISPEDDDDDRWLNDVEVRRDPTHVRDQRVSQWLALLAGAGFNVTHTAMTKVYLEFNDWVLRAATPAQNIEPLRRDFQHAKPSAVKSFGIRQEGNTIHFYWEVLVVRATK